VNASIRGYFSVLYTCTRCTVSSIDTWGYPDKTYIMSNYAPEYKVSEQFKISQAGYYSYTLTCQGQDPTDITTDSLSLQAVQAVNLPWWREIIPYLGAFLRGL
jgi:predicted AlkP superfamily pyrophosphatase or phosphodiesterase